MLETFIAVVLGLILDLSLLTLTDPPFWFCFMFGLIAYIASRHILLLFLGDDI
jgi:hypothetical protein